MKRSIKARKFALMGRDPGMTAATARVWLGTAGSFLITLQPHKGCKGAFPKGAVSSWALAAWSSIQDPDPGVPGAVGACLSVFVSRVWGEAGAEAGLERLQWHWNRSIWGHSLSGPATTLLNSRAGEGRAFGD